MQIDFMTATPKDVIERSILMHDSVLAENLRRSAIEHRAYAANPTHCDQTVPGIAMGMAKQCERAAILVEDGNVNAIMREMSLWIPTLNLACRLQCVPMSVQKDIVERPF